MRLHSLGLATPDVALGYILQRAMSLRVRLAVGHDGGRRLLGAAGLGRRLLLDARRSAAERRQRARAPGGRDPGPAGPAAGRRGERSVNLLPPPALRAARLLPDRRRQRQDRFGPPSESKARSRSSARTLAVAAGKSGAFFSDATVAGVHARVLTVPIVRGCRASDRQPARQRRPRAGAAEADPAARLARRDRAGGWRRHARLAHHAGAGAPRHRRGRARGEHARHERARARAGQGRAGPAGRLLQRHAGRARGGDRDAEALRRRRLARAADAGDEPADEPRGAGPGTAPAGARSAGI